MQQDQIGQRHRLRAVRRQIGPDQPDRLPRRAILIGVAAAAVLLTAAYALFVRQPLPLDATLPLESGIVEQSVPAEALVVRREKVYAASRNGYVTRLATGGERIRVGTPVVSIGRAGPSESVAPQPAVQQTASQDAIQRDMDQIAADMYTVAVKLGEAKARGDGDESRRLQAQLDDLAARQWRLAQQLGRSETAPRSVGLAPEPGLEVLADGAGILVYEVDGLEGALDPAGGANWSTAWFRSLAAPQPRPTAEGDAREGDPVFKVVDNIEMGLLAPVPMEALSRLPADGRVRIRLQGKESQVVQGRVSRVLRGENDAVLYLTAPVFPDELNAVRRVRAGVILSAYEGQVAPRTALDVLDGETGVWAVQNRKLAFVPVRIVGGNDTEVALETDLPSGTRIARVAPARSR